MAAAARPKGTVRLRDAEANSSERAREHAAVHQQVLPGDVAGVRRAQERASRAEFVRLAEALRRYGGPPRAQRLIDWNALLLGARLRIRAEAIGVEHPRQ